MALKKAAKIDLSGIDKKLDKQYKDFAKLIDVAVQKYDAGSATWEDFEKAFKIGRPLYAELTKRETDARKANDKKKAKPLVDAAATVAEYLLLFDTKSTKEELSAKKSGGGDLNKGSKGEEVKSFQVTLKKLKLYTAKIDGIFGRKTDKAVRAFQDKNGLKCDGIIGKKTAAALKKAA